MALLEYWHFTGDTTYNEELSVGLQWQSGTDGDYMPSNYSSYLVSIFKVSKATISNTNFLSGKR